MLLGALAIVGVEMFMNAFGGPGAANRHDRRTHACEYYERFRGLTC